MDSLFNIKSKKEQEPKVISISSNTEGYLKQANFLNAYNKKYFIIVNHYMYSGKNQKNVKKKFNLKRVFLDRVDTSKTKFVLQTP